MYLKTDVLRKPEEDLKYSCKNYLRGYAAKINQKGTVRYKTGFHWKNQTLASFLFIIFENIIMLLQFCSVFMTKVPIGLPFSFNPHHVVWNFGPSLSGFTLLAFSATHSLLELKQALHAQQPRKKAVMALVSGNVKARLFPPILWSL